MTVAADEQPADESVEYFTAHAGEIGAGDRRWRYRTWGLAAVVLTGLACWLAVAAARAHGLDARSRRIQRHGVPAAGTVTAVSTEAHAYRIERYSRAAADLAHVDRWCRSVLTVRLDRPVGGGGDAVVGSRVEAPAHVGQHLTVRLDPRDVAYGELPGEPVQQPGGWVVLAGLAVATAGGAVWAGTRLGQGR